MTATEFGWPLRVYIEDTDAGGIVFYVNYLKYMERARTELLRSVGFDKNYIFSEALMFVVRSVNVVYRVPARLDDELIATAHIVERGAAQLSFEQRILRGAEEICGGRINIACVDKATLKPKRIPKTLLAALLVESKK